jgi:hypothetical protein
MLLPRALIPISKRSPCHSFLRALYEYYTAPQCAYLTVISVLWATEPALMQANLCCRLQARFDELSRSLHPQSVLHRLTPADEFRYARYIKLLLMSSAAPNELPKPCRLLSRNQSPSAISALSQELTIWERVAESPKFQKVKATTQGHGRTPYRSARGYCTTDLSHGRCLLVNLLLNVSRYMWSSCGVSSQVGGPYYSAATNQTHNLTQCDTPFRTR